MTAPTLSNTRIGNFQRCRQRYVWSYLDQGMKEIPKSAGLRRGEAMHAGIETFYRGEMAATPLHGRITDSLQSAWDLFQPVGDDMIKDWDLMEKVLVRYFRQVAVQDQWVVRDVEITLDSPPDVLFKLTGRIDLVVQSGGTYFVDHKFNKQVSHAHLPVDTQVSTYLLLARMLGMEVDGVIYNVVRMAEGGIAEKEPVVRQVATRSRQWLDAWEKQLVLLSGQIERFHDGYKPEWNSRSFTANCHWDCSFYEHCQATMNNY